MARAMAPIGLALVAAAPSVVELLYGPRWAPAAIFVRALLVVVVCRPFFEDLAALLGAIGRPRLAAVASWSGALTLLGLGAPLTVAAGGVGAAVAVGLAYLVATLVAYRCVRGVVALPVVEVVGPVALAFLVGGVVAVVVAAVVGDLVLPVRLALEAGLPLLAFGAVLLLLERRRLIDRVRDALRLARSGS
jgi:PST family polysaccharide transporter